MSQISCFLLHAGAQNEVSCAFLCAMQVFCLLAFLFLVGARFATLYGNAVELPIGYGQLQSNRKFSMIFSCYLRDIMAVYMMLWHDAITIL